jgi:hypothetical protein
VSSVKRLVVCLVVFGSVLFGAAGLTEASITFLMTTPLPCMPSPAGSKPWATATFTSSSLDTVQLTLQANFSDGNFVDGKDQQFGWGFNYIGDVSALFITSVGGTNPADNVLKAADAYKADGDGLYDILFQWDAKPGSRFEASQTAIYTLTAAGLTEANFDALSTPTAGNGTTWHSAMHVQGMVTDDPNVNSAFVGDGPAPEPAPEPATLLVWSLLFGAGWVRLSVWRRRKTA